LGVVVFDPSHDAVPLVHVDHGVWMSVWPSRDWSYYQKHTEPTDQAVGASTLAYSIIVL
jgi:hypothetical protein